MSDLRGWLDDRDEADIQKLFDAFYEPDKPSTELDDRLTRLVLSEVRTVFAGAAVDVASAPRIHIMPRPTLMERLRRWLDSLQPGQSLALAGASALAVLLIFFGISRMTPRPTLAAATVTGGEVTVLQQRTNTYRTYFDGDLFDLGEGDQLLTAGGTATVQLFPFQTAIVDPDSHVVFAQLDAAADTTQVELLVTRGRVNNLIDEELAGGDRYLVTSSVVEAAVTGTEFSFETMSPTEVVVQTKRGAVQVTQTDQSVVVGEGEQVATLAGAPLIVEPSQDRLDRPTLLVIAPGAPGIPVFAEPNEQARRIGFAADGVLLRVLDKDASGTWYQICCVEQEAGWLKVDAIPVALVAPDTTASTASAEERSQSSAVASVVSATETPTPDETPTNTPTAVATAVPTGTSTGTSTTTPTRTPTVSPTASATASATPTTSPTATATTLSTATATTSTTPTVSPTVSPTPTRTPTAQPTDEEKKQATPTQPATPTKTPTLVAAPTTAPTFTATLPPTATATPPPQVVTPTPTLDLSGQATATDTPAPEIRPTLITVPTPTATSAPADTPRPTSPPPTNTPEPTETPQPTETPTSPPPTNTPQPTEAPGPTDTPEPTVAPTTAPPPEPQPASAPDTPTTAPQSFSGQFFYQLHPSQPRAT